MGQSGRRDVYPRMNAGRCLARIAAFAPEVGPLSMLDWLRRQSRTKFGAALWRDYTDSLRAHRRAERLLVMIHGTENLPEHRAGDTSQLVLLACEDGVNIGANSHERVDSIDPFVVIAKVLRGETVGLDVPVAAPEPWVLRLREYEFYQH